MTDLRAVGEQGRTGRGLGPPGLKTGSRVAVSRYRTGLGLRHMEIVQELAAAFHLSHPFPTPYALRVAPYIAVHHVDAINTC